MPPLVHPIYPRPVSPLVFEPLYTRPEDIIWEPDSAGEKSDQDEGVRAAKRRRIEKLGEAYLRGEELFILSAGIRGPIARGWVNPWAKKKKKGRLGSLRGMGVEEMSMTEVPETVERGGGVADSGKRKRVFQNDRSVPERRSDVVNERVSVSARKQEDDARKSPLRQEAFIVKSRTLDEYDTRKESDATEWLKKNSVVLLSNRDIHPQDVPLDQTSPSSRARLSRQAARDVSQQPELTLSSTHTDDDADSFDGRAETSIRRLRRRERPSKSPISVGKGNVVDIEASKMPETVFSREQSLHSAQVSSVLALSEDITKEDVTAGTRSPASKIPSQRPPSPPAETADEHDTQLPPSHGCEKGPSTLSTPTCQPNAQPTAGHPSTLDQQPPLPDGKTGTQSQSDADQAHLQMPPPTLSTETSNATIFSVMPSAQVLPAAQAAQPNPSLPSTGDKLSEQAQDHGPQEEDSFQMSTQTAIAAANLKLQQEFITPHPPTTFNVNASMTRTKSKSGITLFSALNQPKLHSTFRHSLSMNTQEMLDAVTPFNPTTTVKKGLLTIAPDSESPTITTYQKHVQKKLSKVRKKASFASPDAAAALIGHNSGPSKGCIKASLKVSKKGIESVGMVEGAKKTEQSCGGTIDSNSPGPSLSAPEFGKLGLDMETSASEDEREAEQPAVEADATTNDLSEPSRPTPTTISGQDAQKINPERPVTLTTTIDSQHHHTRGPEERPEIEEIFSYTDFQASQPNDAAAHDYTSYVKLHADVDADVDPAPDPESNFDLSAAMDEVGSFLQSWDLESEMRDGKVQMQRQMQIGKQVQKRETGAPERLRLAAGTYAESSSERLQ